NSYEPTITVRNTYNGGTYAWPDIDVNGEIDNLDGSLTIDNSIGQGSIRIYADVRASNQTIVAGGSVYITGVTNENVGGDPSGATSPWSTVLGDEEAGNSSAANTAVDNINFTSTSSTPNIYGDSVVISAEFINIDGVIQSGQSNYTLSIGQSTATEIQGDINAGKTGLVYLNSVSNSDFAVYYDTSTNSIQVNDVKVSGGYVELHGNILSTGNGAINVLGGYGNITINNTTKYNVVL